MGSSHCEQMLRNNEDEWKKAGTWGDFFSWQPYRWYRSSEMEAPVCSEELLEEVRNSPGPGHIRVEDALDGDGAVITSGVEGDIPLWIHALTPNPCGSARI